MPRQKQVEILVVGNELLNGTTLDTNSFWLSKELVKIGFKVQEKTTVRDELPAIKSAFKNCIAKKPNWVFSIGGMGPTYDDMTVRGLSLSLGRKLKLDPTAVRMLKESYKRRANLLKRPTRKLTKASLKMAMLPRGATPIQNPVGSAPSVLVEHSGVRIVSLPGVPSEMKTIFLKQVRPMMRKDSNFVHAEEWIRIKGISESRLSPTISETYRKYGQVLYVKSHPRGFENGRSVIHVQIILTTQLKGKKKGLSILNEAAQRIEVAARRLGGSVSRIKSI